MKIAVREFGGPRHIILDATQTRLFQEELRRIRRHFPAGKGAPRLAAPDCVIAMANGKKRTEYELYAGAILLEKKTKKTWQFYFGVLLLEWLSK